MEITFRKPPGPPIMDDDRIKEIITRTIIEREGLVYDLNDDETCHAWLHAGAVLEALVRAGWQLVPIEGEQR